MRLGWILLGTAIVGTIGVVAFLSSARAAAAELAAEGFIVADDCSTIEVVDQDAATTALQKAAISIFPSMNDPAVGFLDACLARMFPQCADRLREMSIVFQHDKSTASVTVPLGVIRLYLHDKTVGDVRELLEKGDLEGAAYGGDVDVRDFITSAIFGR